LKKEDCIFFFNEDHSYSLKQRGDTRLWLEKIAAKEAHKILELNYIFCSDEYLLQINKEYLQHDFYTDIITFDNSEVKGTLEGDIFISIDRVKENARTEQTRFRDELHRVMAHGLLHLCGYKDKTPAQQKIMRQKENAALLSRKF